LPSLGRRCHELRIHDADATWRIIYRLDPDALIVVEVFGKKTQRTPLSILDACRDRLRRYDATVEDR
jgi:phage-related protein